MTEREQFEKWATQYGIGRLWRDTEPGYTDDYADSHTHMAWRAWQGRAQLAAPVAAQEPDWSDSKTLPSELWKNPQIPMRERLEIADGAVRFRNDVIANLRRQIAQPAPAQGERQPDDEWQIRALRTALEFMLDRFEGRDGNLFSQRLACSKARDAIAAVDAAAKDA